MTIATAVFVLVLLSATSANAATVDRALTDVKSAPTPSVALASLQAQKSVCSVGPTPKGRLALPSESKALAAARALLAADTSPAKLTALLAGSKLEAQGVYSVALAGLANADPGVSLVGFLAAHQRDPSDPVALLDAAVILSSMGHQPQALALLDAAGRLGAAGAPMGVSMRALIDNATGVARFRLGLFSQAAAQFRAASGLASNLPQPKRNLAAALLCEGQAQQAVTPYIAGTYSDSVQSQPSSATTNGETPPVPGSALDLSQGTAGTLPPLTIPTSAEDGAASEQDIAADATDAGNVVTQEGQQVAQSTQQVASEQSQLGFKGAGLLTIDYEDSVLSFWNNWQTDQPNLGALYAKVQADYAAIQPASPSVSLEDQVNGIEASCDQLPTSAQVDQCLQSQCWPAVQEGHAEWLPQIQGYDADVRAFASAIYEYATALASNLANAAEITAITAQAQQEMYVAFAGELDVIAQMGSWEADWESLCLISASGTAAGEDGMGDTPAASPCPPALSGVKVDIDLAIFHLEVSCDEVSVSASDGEGLGPYVSGKYKFSDGSITALVGAKAGFELNEQAKAEVTGGVYITWDGNGNLTDVGIQVDSPSISGDWGSVTAGDDPLLKVSLAPELID